MASEIRVNKITHTTGVGTVTTNTHGIVVSGIVTATTLKGNVEATTGSFSGNLGVGGVLTYEDVTNIDSIGIITARSTVSIADSIIHTGDTNTSLRFPAADTITAETGGSERLRIDSSGRVGITSIIPASKFTVKGGSIFVGDNNMHGGSAGVIEFGGNTGHLDLKSYSMGGNSTIRMFTSSSGTNTERLRIFSDGKFGFGTDSLSETTMAEFSSSTGGGAIGSNITIRNSSTNSVNNIAELRLKTAHGVARIFKYNTSETVFMSHHGGASDLIMQADGASNFKVNTNGAERLRIGSSGQFGIGGATYGTSGQVLTSGGASAAPTWAAPSAAAGSVYDTFHGQGFSGSAGNGYITSGWGKPGGPGGSWANGPSGKLITESSGIFSFPSTGIYYISFQMGGYAQNVNNRIIGNRIYATNSNANPPAHLVAHAEFNVKSFSGISNGVGYGLAHAAVILKVTNTTNDKVAFWWQSENNYNIGGGYDQMAIFYKLADL